MVDVAGLSSAADKWKTLPVQCIGGLNTSVDTLSYKPGEAFELINFEPSLFGGYRRINGFVKYDTNALPGTGNVLGVCVFPGNSGASGAVVGCRGANVYSSTGSGWGSPINSPARTSAGKYRFCRYVLGASGQKIAGCDGVNPAFTWDGTTYTLINGTGAPANPKYCTFFNSSLILAGYSARPGAVTITVPSSDTNCSGVAGAIEINTYGIVTGVYSWRAELFIFCSHGIFKLDGTDPTTYVLSPVTQSLGCIAPDSIVEVNGNVLYLTPDGVRTISGTERIGDVGLASITKQILSITSGVEVAAGSTDNISAMAIHGKNQYRLFYPATSSVEADSLGLLGAVRQGHSVNETAFGRIIDAWEWGQIQGIKPYCCDSDFINGIELNVHGGFDGFVYQQELGNAFNGANINASYVSAPLVLDDAEIRKLMQKLDIFYRAEGVASIAATISYEFGDATIPQPQPVLFTEGSGLYVYDGVTSLFDTAVFSSGRTNPKITANIQGSGFVIQVQFTTNDMNPSYSIQAWTLQYRPLGRR